jgi:hypothetical protein
MLWKFDADLIIAQQKKEARNFAPLLIELSQSLPAET